MWVSANILEAGYFNVDDKLVQSAGNYRDRVWIMG
jgi:hypothetical protein